jgi:3-dehydroquinate synthase
MTTSPSVTARLQGQPGDVTIVPVALGERSYDVVIGEGLMARAGELIKGLLNRPRVIIVTDET